MEIDLKPASKEDIYNKANANLWDIKAARILDTEKIEAWLKEQASNKISGRAALGNPEKIKEMREAALASYEVLSNKLENLYNLDTMRGIDQILKDAQKGVFEEKAPTTSTLWGWRISLFMAGILELAFFSYMVMYKGAGGLLIGMAIIILVGGYCAGQGLASLMTNSQKCAYEATEVKVEKKYIFLLVLGVGLMASVTALRYAYGGPLAGIIAALFGAAVTTSEAFLDYYGSMRKYYLDKMFQAQTYYAALNLRKDLKDENKYEDDSWYKHFRQYVDEAMGSYKNISADESDVAPPEKKQGTKPPKDKLA